MEILIPTVSFSSALQANGQLTVNWIGEYIQGVYKYLLGFSVIVAIVMVMIGGLQYLMAAGTGNVGSGKEKITNAVVGLVLLFGVYVILYAVEGGRLVAFPPLTLQEIPPAPAETEDDSVNGTLATSFGNATSPNVQGRGATKVPTDLVDAVKAAGDAVAKQGYSLSIASSFRSVADQVALIERNCQNPPGSATCNPKPGHPQTCILQDNNPARCPHTTGHALDVWGFQGGSQCVSQDVCLQDKDACRANPCQAAVIAAMRAQGFCNSSSEPWHFEKPKMSSNCS